MKITPHFSLNEFACRDGTPYPAEWIEPRLRPLCGVLERLRARLGGKAITIVSGFRTPAHNARIGGARRSQHKLGRAADIKVRGVTPARVHAEVLAMHREGHRLGGLGFYPAAGFVHVDTRPGTRLARWQGSRVVS